MFLERKHAKNPSPLLVWCRPRTWWNSTFGPIPAWCTLWPVLSGTKYWRYATLAKPDVAQVAGETPKSPTANCWSQRSWLCFLRRGGCWPKKTWIEHEIFESLESFCLLLLLLTTVLMSQSQRYSAKQPSMHWTALFAFLPSSFAFWYPLLHLWKDGFSWFTCFYICRGTHAIKIPMTCALLVLRAGHGSSQDPILVHFVHSVAKCAPQLGEPSKTLVVLQIQKFPLRNFDVYHSRRSMNILHSWKNWNDESLQQTFYLL